MLRCVWTGFNCEKQTNQQRAASSHRAPAHQKIPLHKASATQCAKTPLCKMGLDFAFQKRKKESFLARCSSGTAFGFSFLFLFFHSQSPWPRNVFAKRHFGALQEFLQRGVVACHSSGSVFGCCCFFPQPKLSPVWPGLPF